MGQQSLFNNCQDADSFHLCTWTTLLPNFYRPQTKFVKVMFLHVSVSHSIHSGGRAWLWGACMVVGGMHCCWGGVHGCGGHAWLPGGVCGLGGLHSCWGGMCGCGWGVHGCGGHAWLLGGMGGCRGVCMGYDEIQSMSGRYASYWNAFLFPKVSSEIPS